MSRRHKEQETESNYKPQQAESRADGSHERDNSFLDKILNFTITKRDGTKDRFSLDKIVSAVANAFKKASVSDEIEVDDKWVKIPRRYFDDSLSIIRLEEYQESNAEERRNKGRPWLKRLINKVEDSKVVGWFKTTLHEAKQKCKELYQGITQIAVCFLKGIHEVMVPDEDPYGKVSHYHRMLAEEIPDIPSRETLSRHYRWFVSWKKAETYEDGKAKNERNKHRIWERLVHWIKELLKKLAPQYAAQPIYGVGI